MMMAGMMMNCLHEVVEKRQCEKSFSRSDQYCRFSLFQSSDKPPTRFGSSHNPSVIRQKGESQNGCFEKTKHAKFSEKRTFLNP